MSMHTPAQMPCPQGCGNSMMFATEKQAGACRFCQGEMQNPIPQSNPHQGYFPPPEQMRPGYRGQPAQAPLPPHVQVVRMNSPEQLAAMGAPPPQGPPVPQYPGHPNLQAHQQRALAAQASQPVPQQAEFPAAPPHLEAVVKDAMQVIRDGNQLIERMSLVIAGLIQAQVSHAAASYQADMPPPMITPPPVATPTPPPPQVMPANGKKFSCMACAVASIGAEMDPTIVIHTCEMGKNGAQAATQVAAPA